MHRWFTVAVFAGASLLFTIEPMIGRLVLPLAGGTPAVWTTCLLFFQALLLAGYAYAHAVSDRLPIRLQVPLHLAVLSLPVLSLPIGIDQSRFMGTEQPVLALLLTLVRTVGLPFFVVTTTAPLMQRWFAIVEPKREPYPLYSASNAGSLLALAAYPFVIEPAFGLVEQGRWWAVGYGIYLTVIVVCSVLVWRAPNVPAPRKLTSQSTREPWLRWVLLSFAPSSLLMGTTATITTDITPVPLLWVAPLALYLLTFIMAFASRSVVPHWLVLRIAPIAVLAAYLALLTGATSPWWAILAVHLVSFFFVSLACHGELSKLRPSVDGLTRYYLWISVGGVLGGILNAIIAPIVFRKVGLAEYPLVIAFAMWLLPNRPRAKAFEGIPELRGLKSLTFPTIIGGLAVALVIGARLNGWNSAKVAGLVFGIPLLVSFLLVDRPRRFASALFLVWFAGQFFVGDGGTIVFLERNFFGLVRVAAEHNTNSHLLIHGSTIHGRQLWHDGHGVNVPLTYYAQTGPIGDIFRVLDKRGTPAVAACGLGAGSIAFYSKTGQPWTFFDIDPAMIQVAQNPQLFTLLADNFPGGQDLRIVQGDARLEIAKSKDQEFGLIVLDAFSSDSIPVHLLTREAVKMYLDKLSSNGIIVFHISNRYLDLRPVLASVAHDLHLEVRSRYDEIPVELAVQTGTISSNWVALARRSADLDTLATDSRWIPLTIPARFRTWTDDYSNMLSVFIFDRD